MMGTALWEFPKVQDWTDTRTRQMLTLITSQLVPRIWNAPTEEFWECMPNNMSRTSPAGRFLVDEHIELSVQDRKLQIYICIGKNEQEKILARRLYWQVEEKENWKTL
ncbi:hypothetical protein MPTK1_6g19970 [Marchantia polymorpha subsp. ruderalis]|uniref:Uncharacterized protein n=2 Tax=Marchantia polymorpha TaxID=3197 RepID=A0AAF6BU00_MARPO|nr:hypothetical protein MARPO_0045s0066 [Marchantia polymorpha]BBN15484.1 hypothetical protein Mp_6g19970 [Marchantia polymorpha subsp. ruderalis]|eukprot:PTQ39404.1 hypothetical protein MARPO_0045s0066 [Marchantia polymorpha]